MSAKREKSVRAYQKSVYEWHWSEWRQSEPPRWRFISHWLWKKDEPQKKDYMK